MPASRTSLSRGPFGYTVAIIVVALAGCAGPEPPSPVEARPQGLQPAERESPQPALPLVSGLPAQYRPAGELAGRGMFYTEDGQTSNRIDDGGDYHGYDGPGVWATDQKGTRTQGVLYGVQDGTITSAGYLIQQSDLAAGRSFHGLTLRGLDLPAAHSMTVDFLAGETAESNRYLWLWHFRPAEGPAQPMLPLGQLPPATDLPDGYEVVACDHVPETRFCPGMGRHYTDLSPPVADPTFRRRPTTTGDDGVIYGEAAGKLIFIEYVFGQADLASGVSWPAIPLDGLHIPPIDNVHVLHFGSDESTDGRYTVHMYFIPEEAYLAWDSEPENL